ncbi:hypothetical protein ABMA32_02885 [Mesorhizobium sp. VNQ89]|uniref:hypothetical protein n=1 Tax=Mesorhizobium quangtriensis TaxID=3157709 RepID=UPI0032B8648F
MYFDENELFDRREQDGALVDWFCLDMGASQADLAAIPGGPREGLRVILYEDGLEMEAELEYRQEDQLWVGRYIPGTVRDIPYSES